MEAGAFDAFKNRACPKWFADAGFGIFIHWGIFSVLTIGTVSTIYSVLTIFPCWSF